jgi:CRISPR/Cas system-associated protein Csx1
MVVLIYLYPYFYFSISYCHDSVKDSNFIFIIFSKIVSYLIFIQDYLVKSVLTLICQGHLCMKLNKDNQKQMCLHNEV